VQVSHFAATVNFMSADITRIRAATLRAFLAVLKLEQYTELMTTLGFGFVDEYADFDDRRIDGCWPARRSMNRVRCRLTSTTSRELCGAASRLGWPSHRRCCRRRRRRMNNCMNSCSATS
jgi:hypothetical protein